MEMICYSAVKQDHWHLYIAKTERGLCYVSSPGATIEELESKIKKHYPESILYRNDEALKPYREELQEYLEGKNREFTLPVDIKGTVFQKQIWEALKKIPYGETWSYSEVAKAINRPAAVRAVGAAIGANPVLVTIPCHRVIGKNGAITGYRGGLELKRYLLELELEGNK
ncbi:methylated-DNA--[protein]-cysteine S-methyltransferase [Domibacillus indicus]|uniref:methylated-DNA--[protein]-cysteine S-methyltransferase n=1 Tax=Domibacillus indicus TaxID=1437523 RepID=UPI000618254A|nr:methylated-DNA--[protein]-cysteine S-methyltransferase [Domibacillus indicus]